MIVDTIFFLAGVIITFFTNLLSALTFVVPTNFLNTLPYFLSYLNYISGFFPISTLFLCLSSLLTFYTLWYTMKIGFWIWGHVPYIGKHSNTPTFTSVSTIRDNGTSSYSVITRKRLSD